MGSAEWPADIDTSLHALERRPLRVVSLFDGISTGKVALDKAGFETEVYYASETDDDAIMVSTANHKGRVQQLGDITQIDETKIREIVPIDLVLGGSPCNDLSGVNPDRNGLGGGSGILFFEFVRVLHMIQQQSRDRMLFWMYENVAFLPEETKKCMTKHLGEEPTEWDAVSLTPARRPRCFWGNIPGLTCPGEAEMSAFVGNPFLTGALTPHLSRAAIVDKLRTVTTRGNSLLINKQVDSFPVMMGGQGVTPSVTELERIFGFPEHYTDMDGMTTSRRHRLLGKAWSIPVIITLLQPLRQFFSCHPTRDPTKLLCYHQ